MEILETYCDVCKEKMTSSGGLRINIKGITLTSDIVAEVADFWQAEIAYKSNVKLYLEGSHFCSNRCLEAAIAA